MKKPLTTSFHPILSKALVTLTLLVSLFSFSGITPHPSPRQQFIVRTEWVASEAKDKRTPDWMAFVPSNKAILYFPYSQIVQTHNLLHQVQFRFQSKRSLTIPKTFFAVRKHIPSEDSSPS